MARDRLVDDIAKRIWMKGDGDLLKEYTYNLSALADRLSAEKRHRVLTGKIRQAVRYHSLRSDLIMAKECCEALIALQNRIANPSGVHDAATSYALLTTAVILYVRATKTKSNERDPSDLNGKFTPEQKAVHKELCDLRDKGIAHYGSGGSYDGDWKVELAVVHTKGIESRAGVATRRTVADKPLTNKILNQIEVVFAFVDETSRRKVAEVTSEIDRIITKEDHNFYKEMLQHPLNLDLLLLSPESGNEARAAFGKGYAQGVSRE